MDQSHQWHPIKVDTVCNWTKNLSWLKDDLDMGEILYSWATAEDMNTPN